MVFFAGLNRCKVPKSTYIVTYQICRRLYIKKVKRQKMYVYLVRLKIYKLSPSVEVDYFICIAIGIGCYSSILYYALKL